jgi:hypothetical protein
MVSACQKASWSVSSISFLLSKEPLKEKIMSQFRFVSLSGLIGNGNGSWQAIANAFSGTGVTIPELGDTHWQHGKKKFDDGRESVRGAFVRIKNGEDIGTIYELAD